MKRKNIVILFKTSNQIDINPNRNFSSEFLLKYNLCFSLFHSGKIIVAGNKNEKYIIKALKKVLAKRSPNSCIIGHKILNMLFTGKVKLNSSWEKTRNLGCFQHEPELFPAVYWRKDSALVALFHTGSFNLMGVKSQESARAALRSFLDDIKPVLKSI